MERLIDISDERFWQILFDEACVEGQQAERIEKELEKIVCFKLDKVVEELETEGSLAGADKERYYCGTLQYEFARGYMQGICTALRIVKGGGVNDTTN